MRSGFLLLACFAALAAPASATPARTLKALQREVIALNEDDHFGLDLAKDLGYDKDVPLKDELVMYTESIDGLDHNVFVVVDKYSGPKPLEYVFEFQKKADGLFRSYLFRTDLSGKLIGALISDRKLDARQKIIPGPGIVTKLDSRDPETAHMLQHELDFWLKTPRRKKPAPAKK